MRSLFRLFLALLFLFGVFLVGFKLRYGGPTIPFPDPMAGAGEPLLPASGVEVVATLDEAPGNLAVTKEGRVFVNLHPEGRPEKKVVEIVNGAPVPFPDAAFGLYDGVFSLRVDGQGRLWSLDPGFHGLKQPRLLAVDLATKSVAHRWDIPREICGLGSYAQDFQVSPDGKTVYIADIGVMAKAPAIVVYDVATGRARRLLERDATVSDKPYLINAKGREMVLLGGLFKMHPALDSIALDAAGEWLYYGPMSHETLFRVRTADLLDPALPPATLAARVEAFGPKPQSDGLAMDLAGNVYITAVEHGSIARLGPDRKLVTLVKDPRWRWPDGLSFGPEDWLYLTDSAIPDIMMKPKDHIRKSAPYYVYRVRVGQPGTPGR